MTQQASSSSGSPSLSAAHPRLEIDAACSDFTFLRRGGSYYVDKTSHLPDLLRGHGPLLLTRPRRFGKTLTMDTLRCFLELDYRDPGNTAVQQELFAGLAILQDPALEECRTHFMGQHPVIAVSFARVSGDSCYEALTALRSVIRTLFKRFEPVLMHSELSASDRAEVQSYLDIRQVDDPARLMPRLRDALQVLTELLYGIFSRPVYILIDEYDTPLAKAWSAELASPSSEAVQGYYARMLTLMRGLLLPLLKPDPGMQGSIARCICTGCTRISRESLFSGANNLIVLGMDDLPTAELMGFTEAEVTDMLSYYGFGDRLSAARQWYDGYRFAGVQIYNPWSIAHYCHDLCRCPENKPASHWADAGVNDELGVCLQALPADGLEQLRRLYEGKRVSLELLDFFSYDALLRSPDSRSLFALLYHTGFITRDDETGPDGAVLPRWRIPNAEVRECFEQRILGLHDFRAEAEAGRSDALVSALLEGRGEDVRLELNQLFVRYLSFHAHGLNSALLEKIAAVLEDKKRPDLATDFRTLDDRRPERVYQLYVMGVLSGHVGHGVQDLLMERELGAGRCDLSFIAAGSGHTGCVLEFKRAADIAPGGEDYPQRLQEQCRRAAREGLDQIESRSYAAALLQLYPALREVQTYGIGCAGKRCMVEWRRHGRADMREQS